VADQVGQLRGFTVLEYEMQFRVHEVDSLPLIEVLADK
jgi:hypothetical protein